VTGELRAGFAADVLVVGGDPLEDLSARTRPLLVVARSRATSASGRQLLTDSRGIC